MGLGFLEMDLDEEGRRDLDKMDFWGLGRREEDGEQDLKWRKKNGGRRCTQKSSLLNSVCYSEIESLKLDLLQ